MYRLNFEKIILSLGSGNAGALCGVYPVKELMPLNTSHFCDLNDKGNSAASCSLFEHLFSFLLL